MKPVHIVCNKGDIAKNVLLPGDPLRAKYIADKYLTNVKKINDIRNMWGYTGLYNGKEVTVIGSGMGIPSVGIYSYELYKFYDVENIIRIGSCGSLSPEIKIADIVLVDKTFSISTFAKCFANDDRKIMISSRELNDQILKSNSNVKYGDIFTSDVFDVYADITETLNEAKKYVNPIAAEMECFGLFFIAEYLNKKASALITVVDSKYEDKIISPEEREKSLDDMIETALNAL